MGQILELLAMRSLLLQPGIALQCGTDESQLSGSPAGSQLWEEVLPNKLWVGGT